MTMSIHDNDQADIRDALARLAKSTQDAGVPPIDPAREAALLAAFDARPRTPRGAAAGGSANAGWLALPVWGAAAALILLTISLNWAIVMPSSSRVSHATGAQTVAQHDARPNGASVAFTAPVSALDGFVEWPGASAWPPFESGSLMRVDLPTSLLPTLGLSAPSPAATVVAADIVVGQDGLARAVRLVQQQ